MSEERLDGETFGTDQSEEEEELCVLDACPECGNYYTLTTTAPPMPWHLAEHGTDEEQNQWGKEHNYNILECTVCGWRDDV